MVRGKWWVFVALMVLVVAACSSQDTAETANDSGDGGDVTVSTDGGGGSSVDLPDGLEIPVPDGGEVTTVLDDSSYLAVALNYPLDRYDDIVAFYDDYTEGTGEEWNRSESTNDMGDGLIQRSAQWVLGPDLISASDCLTAEGGSSSFGAVCVRVNQSK